MHQQTDKIRTLAISALLVAVMLVLGYIESLIPAGPVPGIKLGLSNSVLLLAVMWLGIPAAFILMLCKVILSGLLFAGFSATMFSLTGGAVSMLVMAVLYKLRFNTVVTGMAGAVAHNAGQVGLAMLMLQTEQLVYYMAILIIVGLVTGFITGTIAQILDSRIPENLKVNNKK